MAHYYMYKFVNQYGELIAPIHYTMKLPHDINDTTISGVTSSPYVQKQSMYYLKSAERLGYNEITFNEQSFFDTQTIDCGNNNSLHIMTCILSGNGEVASNSRLFNCFYGLNEGLNNQLNHIVSNGNYRNYSYAQRPNDITNTNFKYSSISQNNESMVLRLQDYLRVPATLLELQIDDFEYTGFTFTVGGVWTGYSENMISYPLSASGVTTVYFWFNNGNYENNNENPIKSAHTLFYYYGSNYPKPNWLNPTFENNFESMDDNPNMSWQYFPSLSGRVSSAYGNTQIWGADNIIADKTKGFPLLNVMYYIPSTNTYDSSKPWTDIKTQKQQVYHTIIDEIVLSGYVAEVHNTNIAQVGVISPTINISGSTSAYGGYHTSTYMRGKVTLSLENFNGDIINSVDYNINFNNVWQTNRGNGYGESFYSSAFTNVLSLNVLSANTVNNFKIKIVYILKRASALHSECFAKPDIMEYLKLVTTSYIEIPEQVITYGYNIIHPVPI